MQRPSATRKTKKGEVGYYGPALAVYRKCNGISLEAMSQNLHTTVHGVWKTEHAEAVARAQGDRFLRAVDYLVSKRNRVVRDGEALAPKVAAAEAEYLAVRDLEMAR